MIVDPQHADQRQRPGHRPADPARRPHADRTGRRRSRVTLPPGALTGLGTLGILGGCGRRDTLAGVGDYDPGRLGEADERLVRRVPGDPERVGEPAGRDQPVTAQMADRLPARRRYPGPTRSDRPILGEAVPITGTVLTVEPALAPSQRHRHDHQVHQPLAAGLLDPLRGHPALRTARGHTRSRHQVGRPPAVRLTFKLDDLDSAKPTQLRDHSTANIRHAHPFTWRSWPFARRDLSR